MCIMFKCHILLYVKLNKVHVYMYSYGTDKGLTINSRRTSPVPLNIDSLFHVRMTNSYFCAPSLSCAFGIIMQWKYAISPQFILVFLTKLHL